MNKLASVAIIFLAIALAYFSYALIGVAKELRETRIALPAILTQIDRIEDGIDVDSWLQLSKQIHALIPSILQEVHTAQSSTIPELLNTIPEVLKEIKLVRTDAIAPMLQEIELVRTLTIPPLLQESQALREMTPQTLDQVSAIIHQANNAVDQASKKAAEGAVKGVILSPVNLLKDASKNAVGKSKNNKLTDFLQQKTQTENP